LIRQLIQPTLDFVQGADVSDAEADKIHSDEDCKADADWAVRLKNGKQARLGLR